MSTKTKPTEREWVSANAAGALLGVHPSRIAGIAAQGYLATRVIPGQQPRYRREDCVRLAEQAVRPATASLATASK